MNKALHWQPEEAWMRIITPGIPDKKFVYKATRSYYNRLVKRVCVFLSIRRDFVMPSSVYRMTSSGGWHHQSGLQKFIHHFENAAAFYRRDAVAGVKADFDHFLKNVMK